MSDYEYDNDLFRLSNHMKLYINQHNEDYLVERDSGTYLVNQYGANKLHPNYQHNLSKDGFEEVNYYGDVIHLLNQSIEELKKKSREYKSKAAELDKKIAELINTRNEIEIAID